MQHPRFTDHLFAGDEDPGQERTLSGRLSLSSDPGDMAEGEEEVGKEEARGGGDRGRVRGMGGGKRRRWGGEKGREGRR